MLQEGSIIQNQRIQNYYRFQSMIYDSTRWSFLFGRNLILDRIAKETSPQKILEIGCGTGYNLKNLSKKFPNSKILGLDVSADMIQIAQKKNKNSSNIQLIESPYGTKKINFEGEQPDVILFSYMLTMVNPDFSSMILQAYEDLKPGGYIAVVDFYNSKHSWFRNHMSNHHVRMESHLHPILERKFEVVNSDIFNAYFGVWEYFTFLGKKK
ncbi:class I SAM-dependent methyltransferase [Tenacibaculum sp. M341]|uniref:class I SAM-dependent methyltransferase n=1 Tax=Tenacibaculum sp. M341 TaxID=2530339 RepID=UPI001053E7DE|nr:class I SAM-dependent methyltransferase [Tenacibaculum sp. M341]TCI93189.1 class I SAM-dependent methyltransferase [Tenacibaculum sp. M341]